MNLEGLKGAYCVGHCCEPVICDGDYVVVNTKLIPKIGDYVSYKNGGYKLAKLTEG